jgi:hypothetical protein
MIDYQLYGNNPFGHHMTSLIIHLLNTLLLFYLLFYSTKKYWQSLFVAAVFALHPLHVESVAWAAERKDVLSTFFMMLTCFFSFSIYKTKILRSGGLVHIRAMSKPMLVSLPCAMAGLLAVKQIQQP